MAGPKGIEKSVLVYLILAGVVLGGLAGWTVRANRLRSPLELPPTELIDAATADKEQTLGHPLVFTTEDTPPAATPDLLSAEAPQIYCFYRFPDLPPDAQVTAHWWHNGAELGPIERTPPDQPELVRGRQDMQDIPEVPEGAKEPSEREEHLPHLVLRPPGEAEAFAPGIYEVELRGLGQELGRGSFAVAEGAEEILAAQPSEMGQTRIINCLTARRLSAKGEPEQPQKTFRGTDKVFVAFTYINGTAGGVFRVEWYCQEQLIEQATQELEIKGGAGRGSAWLKAAEQRLPAGEYRVAIFLQGVSQPLAQARFTVQD